MAIDDRDVLSYLPGVLLVVILAWAWWRRRSWGRPVVMLIVCYVGLLLPALGFVNIYFMEYSLVADHWQYAAMIVPCAVFAGVAATLVRRRQWGRPAGYVLCSMLLAILATLTWQQSRMYADIETLYRRRLPGIPIAGWPTTTSAKVLAGRGQVDEAIAQYRKALEIKPDYAEAHNNLGIRSGRPRTGRRGHRPLPEGPGNQARLRGSPQQSRLSSGGPRADRRSHRPFQKAIEIKPDYAEAHNNLGNALAGRGQVDEAIAHYQKALEIKPDYAEAHNNLGNALAGRGQIDEAIAQYQKAMEIKPDYAEAHNNLGSALAVRGQIDEAIAHYQKALEIKPDDADARQNCDVALARRKSILHGLAERRELIRSRPSDTALLNDTAWILATNPNASVRNGTEAVALAERAVKLSGGREPVILDTLAAAYAEAGRFSEAVETAHKALDLARQQNKQALAESIQAKIRLYEAGTPFHELQASPAKTSIRP